MKLRLIYFTHLYTFTHTSTYAQRSAYFNRTLICHYLLLNELMSIRPILFTHLSTITKDGLKMYIGFDLLLYLSKRYITTFCIS